MNREEVVKRVEELATALENSAAQHNALAGRLAEARLILEKMDAFAATMETALNAAAIVSSD